MDSITNAILGHRAASIAHMAATINNSEEVLTPDADPNDVTKGEEQSEGEEQPTVEKSDILNSISDGHNPLEVIKTGAEIKAQVKDVLIPELNAALTAKEIAAHALLEKCGEAPTKCPDLWWTGDIKMDTGWFVYDWSETEFCAPGACGGMMPSLTAADAAAKAGNAPADAGQAADRREYNNLVRAICNVKTDLKACEILLALKDNGQFRLTPRQVLALKFNG